MRLCISLSVLSQKFLSYGSRVALQLSPSTRSIPQNLSRKKQAVTRTYASTTASWPRDFLTRAEVAKRFEEFDTNGDGFLSPQEVQSAIDCLRAELNDGSDADSLWHADHDKNGFIDYHEFMTYFMGFKQEEDDTISGEDAFAYYGLSPFSSWDVLLEYCSVMHATDLMGNKTRNAYIALIKEFKSLDENGDGFLSEDELRSALLKTHPESGEAQIRNALAAMFTKADANKDGQVDFYEFASTFRNGFIQDITCE